MKRLFLFFVCSLFAMIGFAQGNSGLGFNYQAVVRGVDGFILPRQSVELRFSLMPGQSATEASWVETHNVMTDDVGTIGVTVGKGTRAGGVAATFSDVNFAAVHYWLKVEIRENDNYRELSYTQLTSVPYAEVANNAGVPAGTVVAWAGNMPVPTGWLLCDGQAVSRTQYAALYGAIGTAWGYGNNSTTFNLPDMQGVFLRGVARDRNGSEALHLDPDARDRTPIAAGGNTGNRVGTKQGDAIRNILGSVMVYTYNTGNPDGVFASTILSANTISAGSTSRYNHNSVVFNASNVVPVGSDNRPLNVSVYYIIKY